MASTEGLMPITRDYLSRFYDNYPFVPLSDDVSRLTDQLKALSSNLKEVVPLTQDETILADEADCSPPNKIDENMWKNREHIEEIIFLLERSQWPSLLQQQSIEENVGIPVVLGELKARMQSTLKIIEAFQAKNSENIFSTVITYMPQDFRGTLIRQQRERSERNKQAEIDALVNSGGKIRDRYALLWKQQMDRRRNLAQLGAATGVFKTLVKYLVGVPQVLLDFIRQINDDHGPMEEQRHRYGPSLYSLTAMAVSIHLFINLSWGRFKAKPLEMDSVTILEQAVNVYTSEMKRFVIFITEVFANSPFLIPAEDAAARKSDEYKETIITPGTTHEVLLAVDAANSYIAWDFSVIQGKMIMDIGFRVEYINPSGEITMILPYRRYNSNQGNFCTIMTGNYKLIWDNSYSKFFKKNLRYKVDSIPPVTEPVEAE